MSISSPHHSFDVALAEEYSIEEAILIHHFQHWIRVNRNLKRNFKDGKWWTYQTREEMAAHFPYWSHDQIRRITDKLIDRGVLIKGREGFNKTSMDRTLWYAFADESRFIPNLDLANLPKGFAESASSNHILKPDPKSSPPKRTDDSAIASSSSSSAPPKAKKEEMMMKMKNSINATEEEVEEAWQKYDLLDHTLIPHPAAWFKTVIRKAQDEKRKKEKEDEGWECDPNFPNVKFKFPKPENCNETRITNDKKDIESDSGN